MVQGKFSINPILYDYESKKTRISRQEVSELELKKFILNECSKLKLKGIKVIDFSIGSASIRFLVAVEQSTVDFIVNDDNEFRVLSVLRNGEKLVKFDYLSQFNDFITDLIAIIKPVVKEKMDEHASRFNTIEYREAQAKLKEEQLKKRALGIQAREQLLEYQMQAIDVERQLLKDEKLKKEVQKVRKWTREHNFLFKWLVVASAVMLVVLLLIFL